MPLFETKIFIISCGSPMNDVIAYLGQGGGERWANMTMDVMGFQEVKISDEKSKDDVIYERASCTIFCFNRSEDYLTFLLLA